ncbi:hypothetical protein HPB49_015464 [Dermacentor silvarum]|uniref:Uncharacterized protein n=1 Tax=Dermacentor silvarum TaxID=543639 RepID=A0ACB8E1A2_DERSI|nr:hypothetical protein HPB49_015464 [Dermacentor silvarum]
MTDRNNWEGKNREKERALVRLAGRRSRDHLHIAPDCTTCAESSTKGPSGADAGMERLNMSRYVTRWKSLTAGGDVADESTGSECVRRVAEAVVNAGVRNKCDHFPKTYEEKAAVKEGFLRPGAIPGVIGCTDDGLIAIIAPKGERNTAFMSRKGYYAENCMFICDADMSILTVYPMRPGSDHDSFVWWTTWLRRRFQAGRIANSGAYLIGDSGYPLDPWLLTPVPGHPPMQTAEGKYNTAHATLRSVVERCIGLLMSRFRCLQRYLTVLYEPERAANIVAACAV